MLALGIDRPMLSLSMCPILKRGVMSLRMVLGSKRLRLKLLICHLLNVSHCYLSSLKFVFLLCVCFVFCLGNLNGTYFIVRIKGNIKKRRDQQSGWHIVSYQQNYLMSIIIVLKRNKYVINKIH